MTACSQNGVVENPCAADGWRRVVLACECDADGNCPLCGIDYTECDCPGPTQDELYDYAYDRRGRLWAKGRPDAVAADE